MKQEYTGYEADKKRTIKAMDKHRYDHITYTVPASNTGRMLIFSGKEAIEVFKRDMKRNVLR